MSVTAGSSGSPTAATRPRLGLVDAIRLDALVSGAAGVLLAAGAPVLDGVLGVRPAVLVPLGVALVGYALALVAIAQAGAPVPWVKLVLAANALWVVLSVLTVLADWLTLTNVGVAFTLVQAAAVALLAEFQLTALRCSK